MIHNWKIFSSLFYALAFASAAKDSESMKLPTSDGVLKFNDVGVEQIPSTTGTSSTLSHHRHPLPPAAMPGILNDFEPRLSAGKAKRMLLSELNYLKNQYLPATLNRVRRAVAHPRPFPQIPSFSVRRNKRDLRRLRRDLGYDTFNEDEDSYMTQMPYVGLPPLLTAPDYLYGQHARHPTTPAARNLDRLLQGLDFLEQLAILTQIREIPPIATTGPRRPLHAPPSRFAPQPKLFLDDEDHSRPVRVEVSPMGWKNRNRQAVATDPMYWVPEKRWSKTRSMQSLSMVPGLKKRSMFREVEMKQNQGPLTKNEISSLAAILGAEEDPEMNRIRRSAM